MPARSARHGSLVQQYSVNFSHRWLSIMSQLSLGTLFAGAPSVRPTQAQPVPFATAKPGWKWLMDELPIAQMDAKGTGRVWWATHVSAVEYVRKAATLSEPRTR